MFAIAVHVSHPQLMAVLGEGDSLPPVLLMLLFACSPCHAGKPAKTSVLVLWGIQYAACCRSLKHVLTVFVEIYAVHVYMFLIP